MIEKCFKKKPKKQQPKQTNKSKVNKPKKNQTPKAHHLNTNNNPPELEML